MSSLNNPTARFSITEATIKGHGKVRFKTEALKDGELEFSVFVPGKFSGSGTTQQAAWNDYVAERKGLYDE